MQVRRVDGIRIAFVGLLVGMMLSGCAAPKVKEAREPNWFSSKTSTQSPSPSSTPMAEPKPAGKISVEVDEFTKATSYTGPVTSKPLILPSSSFAYSSALLHAQSGKNGTFYNLVVVISIAKDGYLRIQSAVDNDGRILEVHSKSYDREQNCSGSCAFEESLAVLLSRKYLEDHAETGMKIRLNGDKGNVVVELLPAEIALFLNGVPAK
nr:hypothetical protein [uncultured Pseudomonas sp.]